MPVCKKLLVKGIVQGVSYRIHTQRIANDLGINGWVRNLNNGTVEACLEGDEHAVDALIAWCAFGPQKGKVDEVLVTDDLFIGTYSGFSIRQDHDASQNIDSI